MRGSHSGMIYTATVVILSNTTEKNHRTQVVQKQNATSSLVTQRSVSVNGCREQNVTDATALTAQTTGYERHAITASVRLCSTSTVLQWRELAAMFVALSASYDGKGICPFSATARSVRPL